MTSMARPPRPRAALLLRLLLLSGAVAPALALAPAYPVDAGKAFTGQILVITALLAAAASLMAPGASSPPRLSLLPLLGVHAAIGVSCLAAADLAGALARWRELALWTVLIPLTVLAAQGDPRWRGRLAGAVALMGVLAALAVLAAWVGLGGLAPRESGPFGNRNSLGHALALAVWPLVAWGLAARPWPLRLATLGALAAVVQALLLSRSKGAWFGLATAAALGAGLVGVLRWPGPFAPAPHRLRALAAGMLLGVLALATLAALRHPGLAQGEAATLAWDSRSLAVRRGLWAGTLDLIGEHPLLGAGIGQWALAFPPHLAWTHFTHELTRPREAHSDWLQWIAETGALGGLALLVLVAWAGRCARAALGPAAGGVNDRLFAWAAILSLLTLGAIAGIDFPLQQAVPAMLGAILLGALVCGRGAEGSAHDTRASAGRGRWGLPLALLAVAAIPGVLREGALASHLGQVRAALERPSGGREALRRHLHRAQVLGPPALEAARLANGAMLVDEPRLAEAILSRALTRDVWWFESWRLRAEALLALGEIDQARAAAERAVALGEGLASPWLTLAMVHHVAGHQAEAIEALRGAQTVVRGDAAGQRLLGQWLLEAGQAREAAEALAASVSAESDNAEAWMLLGEARLQLGARSEARMAFERAAALAPDLAPAWRRLGALQLEHGEHASAEVSLRRGLAVEPESAAMLTLLGTALATQWKLEEARAALEEATRRDPNHAEAWRGLGLLCAQEGSPEAGIGPLRRALQVNPADPLARRALEALGAGASGDGSL